MAERRRLPVLQSPPPPEAPVDDDAIEARPPWHWVGFGTIAIFAAWLPLAYAAQALLQVYLRRRFGATTTAEDLGSIVATMPSDSRASLMTILALPNVVALGLASFAGGYLVGRFGSGTTPREASSAGAMVGLIALVLALGGGISSGLTAVVTAIVTLALTIGFAFWGGRVGLRAGRSRAKP